MILPQDYVNYTKISWVDSAGIKHPSTRLFVLLGINKSISIFILVPNPLHNVHAPNGELNEKCAGSKSSYEISHYKHEKC